MGIFNLGNAVLLCSRFDTQPLTPNPKLALPTLFCLRHAILIPGCSSTVRVVWLEIVAVVETDMCAVDAIQFLLGCTFGKGNLIHLDYGKSAFTFHSRQKRKSVRIVAKPDAIGDPDDELIVLRTTKLKRKLTSEEQERLKEAMAERTRRIMEADIDKLFEVKPALSPVPRKARILESLICQECGEATMESRTRRLFGKTLCTSCFEALEKRL